MKGLPLLAGIFALSICSLPFCSTSTFADEKPLYITVVKSTGFNWFKRMEIGVKEFGEKNNINAVQVGPSKADSAMQLQSLEDAISQKPKALAVVPLEVAALEPALAKAKERGIIVITHEAADAKNAVYDVEAFDNAAYGRHLMDELAKRMNYEGQYAVFVGSLTQTTHNAWVDAAIALQKEKYPKMELIGTKNESHDDVAKAYQITKDLLKTYPNLKGIQGSDALDVVGAGQAVEEAGTRWQGRHRRHVNSLLRRRSRQVRDRRPDHRLGSGACRRGYEYRCKTGLGRQNRQNRRQSRHSWL